MQPYAEATCVLKVKPNCQACKMKTMEILGSVCGIYDVDINAEEGLTRVQAVVEPNIFMQALGRTGPHAEPKWVKLQHPKVNRYNYDTYSYRNALGDPYYHSHAPPDYHYPTTDPYYYASNPCYHASPPMERPYAHRRQGPFDKIYR